jgi:sugar lactone lactonase YvrE
VSVGIDGAVYVTDSGNNRVVKLAANSPTQTVESFSGLDTPSGISVDGGGNIYVTDANSNRVLWPRAKSNPSPPWQATSATEWVGPFTDLQSPHGAFVFNGYTFYVVDSGNGRVLTWTNGMNSPEVRQFTGLNNPDGIAVDGAQNIWLADTGNNQVLMLKSGTAQTQTVLPFTGLNSPHGVAIDSANLVVYVTDSGNNRVVKLTTDPKTDATTQAILPFVGLNNPQGVALDGQGNLYVADTGNNRVLKLTKAFAAQ